MFRINQSHAGAAAVQESLGNSDVAGDIGAAITETIGAIGTSHDVASGSGAVLESVVSAGISNTLNGAKSNFVNAIGGSSALRAAAGATEKIVTLGRNLCSETAEKVGCQKWIIMID